MKPNIFKPKLKLSQMNLYTNNFIEKCSVKLKSFKCGNLMLNSICSPDENKKKNHLSFIAKIKDFIKFKRTYFIICFHTKLLKFWYNILL